ncbi:hypothetical protein TIFTF001_017541 [Ficus carica]|uniref:Protein kinase domain-containing protein n=1 Tax=Ficus carica TaxID=3494 RepID=A0AA88A9E0_FICCA|nr:hypothetical protein TIFTF001_017541 [Ficus carica]
MRCELLVNCAKTGWKCKYAIYRKGLKRIHEEGFAHCDLELENILLVRQGNDNYSGGDPFVAKIADLGLTKRVGKRSIGGTRSYWSPEIVRDNIQEQPSDHLGFAVHCFRKVNRKTPMASRRGTGLGYEQVRVLLKVLSTQAKGFFNKCLKRNPSDRPTAEMLLKHPFACELIHENKEDDRRAPIDILFK